MFSLSNIITALLALLVVSMLLFPDLKSIMIRGLMKVGMFQPDIPQPSDGRNEAAHSAVGAATFRDEQGRSFSLSGLKGRVVLLNFWATWCPPCRAEMPSLNALYEKLGADTGIVFLAVDADGDIHNSKAFMEKSGWAIPLAVPNGAMPAELFGGSLPTTVILDRQGRVVMHESGATDFGNKKLEAFLLKLIAADAQGGSATAAMLQAGSR
jgi:thiol-disulfide isomerase/thioredoxin